MVSRWSLGVVASRVRRLSLIGRPEIAGRRTLDWASAKPLAINQIAGRSAAGMRGALTTRMLVTRAEDLRLWTKALEFWEAVNAVLDRPGFQEDRRLRAQLADAADSVLSNISEGFEQPTDRAFAKYLDDSKASAAEVRTRLMLAHKRGYITEAELQQRCDLGDDVGRLATGFIKYLKQSDRRDRGITRRRIKD